MANFIANSTKRHAYRDTPLIDWDLIMVMEPTTMLGALLGSYTNKVSKQQHARKFSKLQLYQVRGLVVNVSVWQQQPPCLRPMPEYMRTYLSTSLTQHQNS